MDRLVLRIRDHLTWADLTGASGGTLRRREKVWPQLRALWPLPIDEFITKTYQILLRRAPSPEERSALMQAVAGGAARADIVSRVFAQIPADIDTIDRTWLPHLATMSPMGVWHQILAVWSRPAAEFVNGLYRILLDRTPDAEGFANQLAALADGVGRADLVRGFVSSAQFQSSGLESTWLNRLDLLNIDGLRRRLDSLVLSGDEAWARGVYDAVLHREPAAEELDHILSWLKTGVARVVVLRSFFDSDEAKGRYQGPAWQALLTPPAAPTGPQDRQSLLGIPDRNEFVVWAYRRMLGRDPSPKESIQQARRLRFLPFWYSRRKFLHRLHDSVEAADYRDRLLSDQAEADRKRVESYLTRAEGQRDNIGNVLRHAIAENMRELGSVRHHQEQSSARLKQIDQGLAGLHKLETENHRVEARHLSLLEERTERIANEQDQIAQRFRDGLSDRIVEAAASAGDARLLGLVIRDRQEEQRLKVEVGLEQLRRLGTAIAQHSGTKLTPPQAPGTPGRHDACRICGGSLTFKFTRRVLHERYEASYHECGSCGALQVPDPYWLAEAYAGEDAPHLWNPDSGRFRRNFTVYCYLRTLAESGLAGAGRRMLDYGGGYGLLTQMLLDGKYDAWTYDPYIAQPFFAPDRLISRAEDLPQGTFDLAAAFEVFEHLTDPLDAGETLRRAIHPEGSIVISTGLYEPGVHGSDWYYLSCDAGQHVLFWTRESFRYLAGRLGFRSVGFFPDQQFLCTILSPLPTEELQQRLNAAGDALRRADFLGEATAGWWAAPPHGQHPLIQAEPAIRTSEGLSCAS